MMAAVPDFPYVLPGAPAIVVGISAAIYHQGYGTEQQWVIWTFCWLPLHLRLFTVGAHTALNVERMQNRLCV